MSNLFTYLSEGLALEHTPTAALTGGQIIQLSGNLVAIAPIPIAANVLGAVQIGGRWKAPYVGNACAIGDNLWWDANGTPYGGAADGCLTNVGSAGDWWVGVVSVAAVANDSSIEFLLNYTNPTQPANLAVQGGYFTSAIDISFVEATHSAGVIVITADAKTVTLPAGVEGMEVTVVNGGVDGSQLVTVDLNGNEVIRGALLTIAATKKALNTKVTAKQGDYIHLICTVTAAAWKCVGKRGIWVTD